MYGKHVNSVPNRIASFHQPRLRSIVTWKVKASVEFGAKLDMSVDNGICQLERSSLKLITNPTVLVSAIRHYYDYKGCYPERV